MNIIFFNCLTIKIVSVTNKPKLDFHLIESFQNIPSDKKKKDFDIHHISH